MPHNRRILIVDDDRDILLTFRVGLESYGYIVDTYDSPQKTLKEFKAHDYDLLLIDIRMPNMSGFELYMQLRQVDKEFRVCFMTSFELYYQTLREFYPNLDVQCFIKKPISSEELNEHIITELDNRK